MRQYDHLFFDLDNTLWDFTTNSKLAMFETLQHTGLLELLPDFDIFFAEYEKINTKLWNDYHFNRITKQKLIIERFCQSFKLFGINYQDWEELNDFYLEKMAIQDHLFKGTIETLEKLKSQNYQMHIITNGFREVQRKKLVNCGLDKYFTKVFISEEVQATKPHRAIFEHAVKSTNAKKKRSLMIGDSWETDIIGALNYGIDQVMFLNYGKNEASCSQAEQKITPTSSYIHLKSTIKTYFINEINNLLEIL